MIHYERFVQLFPHLRFHRKWLGRLPKEDLEDSERFAQRFEELFHDWCSRYMKRGLSSLAAQEIASGGRECKRYWQEMMHNINTLCRYVLEGERVLSMKASMARMLVDTTMPRVRGQDFHLPFPALFIEFPERMFRLSSIPLFSCIGCYVLDMRPYLPGIRIEVVHDIDQDHTYALGFCLGLFIQCDDDQDIQWGDLKQQIQQSVVDLPRTSEGDEFLNAVGDLSEELIHFVVNTILYATSADPDIVEEVAKWRRLYERITREKRPKRQHQLQQQLDRLPRTRQSVLGRTLTINYGAPNAADREEEAKNARVLLQCHRVRGHWRWQPCGAGRSETKHIWVAPYWRGPKDMAEALRRKYNIT